jgi:hypothetical protein
MAAFTMAKDKPTNTSASIRQRLLNHSTAIKTDPNLVLILVRARAVSLSPFRINP